ncbi:MAG: hypothetical protein ACI9LY_001319 [Arenicella sp.]|jgi:hypothetical protein
MIKHTLLSISLVFMFACTTVGQATQEPSAPSTKRVVAIGDVHGDFKQFVKILRATGLVDKRNRWSGGKAHLVQLGDIPDRGPDSRKAMDLLMKLEKSSAKVGGSVTVLIGNHEAMMMTGDLRYVHPGEYASFKDKNSRARRNAYYKKTINRIKNYAPEKKWPQFDKAYKQDWEQRFPLGYVEHQVAWAPTGKYGKWVLSHSAIAKIDDTIFLHGGLSVKYSSMSIAEINTRVRSELARPSTLNQLSLSENEQGPLWYRGWAQSVENEETQAALERVLAAQNARRMVIAHTPLTPVVLPRFGGKLLIVDVGLSAHYGHGFSALEIIDGKPRTILEGHTLPLPNDLQGQNDYLQAAAELVNDRSKIDNYLTSVEAAKAKAAETKAADAAAAPQSGEAIQNK